MGKIRYKRDREGKFATADLPKGVDPESTQGQFMIAERDRTRKRIKLHRLKKAGKASLDDMDYAKFLLDKATEKLNFLKGKLKQKEVGKLQEGMDDKALLLDKLEKNGYNKLETGLGGVTTSYLVKVDDDGRAIVKPQETKESVEEKYFGGDEGMRDVALRVSNSKSEVAAYEVSEALGFGIVPETALRDDGSSIQAWVEDGKTVWDASPAERGAVSTRDLGKLLLLDAVIGNMDRHTQNYMVKGDKVVAIDHGGAFGNSANNEVHISPDIYLGSTKMKDGTESWGSVRVEYHPDDVRAVSQLMKNTKFLKEFEKNTARKTKTK